MKATRAMRRARKARRRLSAKEKRAGRKNAPKTVDALLDEAMKQAGFGPPFHVN